MAHCQNGVPHCAELAAAASGPNPKWKDVGVYNTENWGHIYERISP
jgi:hypothetical protein